MIWPAELVHENVRKVLAKKTLILCATYFFNKTDQILFNVAFPHKYCPPNKCFGKSKQTPGSPVREAGRRVPVRRVPVDRSGEGGWLSMCGSGCCVKANSPDCASHYPSVLLVTFPYYKGKSLNKVLFGQSCSFHQSLLGIGSAATKANINILIHLIIRIRQV